MSKKLTTEEFIEKAKVIHGDKYDYSLVDYINAKTRISINSPERGVFEQRPNNHLNGRGCPICSESKGERKIRNFLKNINLKIAKIKSLYLLIFMFHLKIY